ncbi:putative c2h2 finger domain-containing protein [Rosellinia necatrix]|uniref:Putative c2h2 finger domain-containing protein n=1 Tax=Rosellinia necatrix TaxID=77044 RepID=A0A1W2TI95_ROSNE|nr:putative c2h2 finger domain-containing protein [Rosellinia necatrix]
MAGRGFGAGASVPNTKVTDKTGRETRNKAEGEDELSVVTSDVIKPPQPKIQRTLPSMFGSPQTPGASSMGQQLSPSAAGPSQPPPRMRLAVHIRSSPITPFIPINAQASDGQSTLPLSLGRTRGQAAESHTPTRPPTPDAPSGLEAEAAVAGSEPKKRGRPKGWKPDMSSKTDPDPRRRKRERIAAESQTKRQQSAGQTKVRSQNKEPKRRGRPSRPPELSVREQYLRSEPDYAPYKCEWELSPGSSERGPSVCPAELQNMDTLRKHVYLIHGDEDVLTCRFPHCKDLDSPLHFKTGSEFEQHMETKHFAGYLWHLGEGYQNNGISTLKKMADQLPAYLFDRFGNQVTPSVANQRLETDIQRKERRRKLRKFLYQQNENAPSEEEWKQQMQGIEP